MHRRVPIFRYRTFPCRFSYRLPNPNESEVKKHLFSRLMNHFLERLEISLVNYRLYFSVLCNKKKVETMYGDRVEQQQAI
jgi:hypothetical protein